MNNRTLCIFLMLVVLVGGSCSTRSRKLLQTCTSAGCSSLIIEGGIQVEQCTAEENTIILGGSFVLPEYFVSVDGVTECCKACARQEECNSWNYCTNEDGCTVPDLLEDVLAVNALMNATLPQQSCILLSKRSADATSDKGKQRNKDYSSGQIQRVFLPSMSGYDTNSGKNISSEYDFTCGFSARKSRCEVVGSVTEIAAICSADARCRGFVYGMNSTGDTFGVLKGGDRNMQPFTEAAFEDDPSWTVYSLTEQGLEAQQGPQESSSSSLDLWIILISVIGGVCLVCILVVTVTFVVMSKRYTKTVKDSMAAWQMAQNESPPAAAAPYDTSYDEVGR